MIKELNQPTLVVDNKAVKNHFINKRESFARYEINDTIDILHTKAVPLKMIDCKDLPSDIILMSNFDDWEKVALTGKKYGLHIGTPSRERDKKDRLITVPTVDEFTKKLEKINKLPSKILMDYPYFDILDVLYQKNKLSDTEIEFKINPMYLSENINHSKKTLNKLFHSIHNSLHGFPGIEYWYGYRNEIIERYGEKVKVGINFYAGSPNNDVKLYAILKTIIDLGGLCKRNYDFDTSFPSSISYGGFKDFHTKSTMEFLHINNHYREPYWPQTNICIEHGSNMQGNQGFYLLLPGKMSYEEICQFLPDLNKNNKIDIQYIGSGNKQFARVNRPISYLEKQRPDIASIIINNK